MTNFVLAPTHDDVTTLVRNLIAGMGVESAAILPDASLEDLGLDSLDVVELSQGVKKALAIQIGPVDFADVTTVEDAVTLILGKVRPQ